MNKYLLILLSFVSLQLSAIEIDSVERARMIREGQTELCNLLEYNTHAAPEDKRFMVVIDGDPNGVNYTREKNIGTTEDILDQQTVDAINDTLAAAYEKYHIEMYIIVMKSFDLLFETELPAYPTARDLFTNRLYDETSNINVLRATHQELTYQIAFGSMARTKDYLVYSRAEYKSAYAPGKIAAWDLIKTIPIYGTTTTYPKLDELKDCFHARTTNDPNVMQAGLQYSLKAASARFYESAKYMAVKGAIMTTFTTEGMSDIFGQFHPGSDYESLTEPERRRALSVFAGYSMGDNGIEQEEKYACRIVESTPVEQVPDFLDHLSQVSELNTSPSYQGDKPNKALIKVLIERIDDHVFSGDCYAWFMRAIIQIEMTCPQVVEANLPTTDQDWYNRRIYWDDWSALSNPKSGDHDYEIDVADNGTVNVRKSIAWLERRPVPMAPEEYTEHPYWNSYDPFTLNPFAIVVFTNRSSLGMLQVAGAQPNKPYFAPAIFLQYADDKAFSTNAITTSALIIDAITIVTSGSLISAAVEAGNVAMACFEALQFLGSVANLTANAINDPNLSEAVNTFNIIIGIWGLSKVATYGVQYTVEFIAKARTNELKAVPLSLAQDYRTQFRNVTNWSEVDNATKQQLTKLDDLLKQHVEAGMIISTTKFNRSVIDGLVGFENEISGLAAAQGLSLEEFVVLEAKIASEMTQGEKNLINTIRSSFDYPNANSIMQKVIPKIDIEKYLNGTYTSCKGYMTTAQDGKHLKTYEDLYYGLRLDYSNTKYQLSDGSCGVIRFKSPSSSSVTIPKSTANGGTITDAPPFTGHGFTSANNGRLGAPEWYLSDFATMTQDSELWEIFSDGREVLRGTYDQIHGKFIPVNP